MKFLYPEAIRAITPLLLASVGALIGVCVVMNKDIQGEKSTAALGLAGTAIAGAAGLAQSGKSEPDFSVRKEGEKLQVNTPSEQQ